MGMGDGMAAGGGPPAAAAPPEDQGPTTIFLSKEVLGGKTMKEGDSLKLVIKSCDPETGDCEAAIASEGESDDMGESEGGYEAAFDKAMPEMA